MINKRFIFLLPFIIMPAHANGLISSDVINGCMRETLGFTEDVSINAVFEPKSIECLPGEYLPMNIANCTPCPSEAVCVGGTYIFNETKTQGIIFNNNFKQSKPMGCISNLLGLTDNVTINAVFEPNIITLNWNDGTNTTTTQCTFGQTVTIPNPPTRPGYKFGGWRVKRRN